MNLTSWISKHICRILKKVPALNCSYELKTKALSSFKPLHVDFAAALR